MLALTMVFVVGCGSREDQYQNGYGYYNGQSQYYPSNYNNSGSSYYNGGSQYYDPYSQGSYYGNQYGNQYGSQYGGYGY
jgi:hypothetical protein